MSFSEMRQTIRQSEQARWQYLRRLGQAKYILWYGVLRFGLLMLLMCEFLLPGKPLHSLDTPLVLFFACFAFAAGALSGWFDWRHSEERYAKTAGGEGNASRYG
jgi:hypothetical protein